MKKKRNRYNRASIRERMNLPMIVRYSARYSIDDEHCILLKFLKREEVLALVREACAFSFFYKKKVREGKQKMKPNVACSTVPYGTQ